MAHPLDEGLAVLFDRYDLKGTLFVHIYNREGRPPLSTGTFCRLDGQFETRGHFLGLHLFRPDTQIADNN